MAEDRAGWEYLEYLRTRKLEGPMWPALRCVGLHRSLFVQLWVTIFRVRNSQFFFRCRMQSANLGIESSNHRRFSNRIECRRFSFFFSICKSHRGSLRRAISRGVGVSAGATVWSSSQMSNHALDVRCHRCHMLSPMVLWMPWEHVTKPTLLTLPGTGMCSVISEYCGHGPLSTSSFWHWKGQ